MDNPESPKTKNYAKTKKRKLASNIMHNLHKRQKEEKETKTKQEEHTLDILAQNEILKLENERLNTRITELERELKFTQNLYFSYKKICKDADEEILNLELSAQILAEQSEYDSNLQRFHNTVLSAKINDLLKLNEQNRNLLHQKDALQQELQKIDINSTTPSDSTSKTPSSASTTPNAGQVLNHGLLATSRMKKPFKHLSEKRRRQRIQNLALNTMLSNDPKCNPSSVESQKNAIPLLSEFVETFGCTIRHQKLSASETAYVFQQTGLTRDQARRLRRALNFLSDDPRVSYNIFESDHKVGHFKAKFEAEIKIKTFMVDSDGEKSRPCEFATVENFVENFRTRLQRLVESGNFQRLPGNFSNEIWTAIGGDFGGGSMKITNTIGNVKKRNHPDNTSIIAMCKNKPTRTQLFEALTDIADQVNTTSEIELIIDGTPQMFNIRWFLQGDLEFILDMCGKKSASSKHPCPYCIFLKDKNSIIGNPKATEPSMKRENFLDRDVGEIDPLFNIPPNQIILPSLHIFLGIGQRLIEALEMQLKKLDFDKLTPEERQKYETEEAAIKNTCATIKERLAEKESEAEQLHQEIDGLQQLNDYISGFLLQNQTLDNSTLGGGCMMPFCVARAGFFIEEIYRQCDCREHSESPALYHAFCLGFSNNRQTLTCQNVQIFAAQKMLSRNIPAMLLKKHEELKKLEDQIGKLNDSYQKEVLKSYAGPNMDELNNIFRTMRVTRQLYFHTFTGNHMRKILTQTNFLESLEANKIDERVQQIVTALKFLGKIQTCTTAEFFENGDVTRLEKALDDFKNHLMAYFKEESVYPKLHILWHHFLDFAKDFSTIGFFTEQGVESTHHNVNTYLLPRASFVQGQEQLKWIVVQHYITNCFHDSRCIS
uniref:Uncharacterized protein n=1 Tax=Panagrolaimus sp. JU765 TaxID=591449 RepID=A0AC34QFI4_9BILA